VTVSEPSEFVVCSLKVSVNVSVSCALRTIWPVMTVFGAGCVGTGVLVTFPLASVFVASTPLVTVVEPVTPLSLAVHVAITWSAENCPPLAVEMLLTVELLVTEPPAPVVPCVLTLTGPDSNSVAGPKKTLSDGSEPMIGVAEPLMGSVTRGVGPYGAPTVLAKTMFGADTPKALPLTAETSALDGPGALR
jgi:hypothetical protein